MYGHRVSDRRGSWQRRIPEIGTIWIPTPEGIWRLTYPLMEGTREGMSTSRGQMDAHLLIELIWMSLKKVRAKRYPYAVEHRSSAPPAG